MNKKQIILIVIVIAIGAVLGGSYLPWTKQQHQRLRMAVTTSPTCLMRMTITIMATMTRVTLPTPHTHILKPKVSRQGVKAKAANQARGLKAGNFLPEWLGV